MNLLPTRAMLPLLLCTAAMLPLPAAAAPASGVASELAGELAQARQEVRRELADARRELERENLQLGQGVSFGKGKARQDLDLPRAEITPRGDLLIDGKAVAIDASQRRELLAYRGQVIGVAQAGIEIGERAANTALDVVDRGLFSLIASALSGTLESRLERTIKSELEPGVRQLCERLPALLQSQQRLQASVPAFRPYANLQAEDVSDCAEQVRREFALN